MENYGNLADMVRTVFDSDMVIASVYKPHKTGISYMFKTFIYPFMDEMKQANNVILIVDNNYNITSGQIGLYDIDNGLRVKLF